jgi:hypothetical protein
MNAVARLITLAVLLIGQLTPVFGRASSFEDKTWDAGNISRLPSEVRSALTRMCGPDLAAQQYFAGYLENSKFLVLHFERLRCGDQTAICTQGRCLHQVYGKEKIISGISFSNASSRLKSPVFSVIRFFLKGGAVSSLRSPRPDLRFISG